MWQFIQYPTSHIDLIFLCFFTSYYHVELENSWSNFFQKFLPQKHPPSSKNISWLFVVFVALWYFIALKFHWQKLNWVQFSAQFGYNLWSIWFEQYITSSLPWQCFFVALMRTKTDCKLVVNNFVEHCSQYLYLYGQHIIHLQTILGYKSKKVHSPLVNPPVYEWSTLTTVLLQLHNFEQLMRADGRSKNKEPTLVWSDINL